MIFVTFHNENELPVYSNFKVLLVDSNLLTVHFLRLCRHNAVQLRILREPVHER